MYQYALAHARNEVERGRIKPVEKKNLLAWHLLAERGGKIYLSEMPDVRYVGHGSLGHWEVVGRDSSED